MPEPSSPVIAFPVENTARALRNGAFGEEWSKMPDEDALAVVEQIAARLLEPTRRIVDEERARADALAGDVTQLRAENEKLRSQLERERQMSDILERDIERRAGLRD